MRLEEVSLGLRLHSCCSPDSMHRQQHLHCIPCCHSQIANNNTTSLLGCIHSCWLY